MKTIFRNEQDFNDFLVKNSHDDLDIAIVLQSYNDSFAKYSIRFPKVQVPNCKSEKLGKWH